jgi:type I restriction enzyme, S subunit
VSELNDSTSLPDGWISTSLDKVAEIIMGQSPPGDSYNQEGEGIPLINGPVEFGSEPFSKTIKSKFTTLPTKMCEENDLILCVRGSTTGRMNIAGFDACIGRGVAAIRYKPYQQYVNLFIHSNRDRVYRLGTGSTFPNVSSNNLAELEIPLPPLNEQRRIVSSIEQLTDRSHKARTALEDVPKLIAQLRQSVLAAAFRGDLTADWREKNPDVEPASELLERIKIDRNSVSKGNKNKIETIPENICLSKIPDSWEWIAFGELVKSIRSGSTSVPQDEISDYPILRSSSVRSGVLDLKDIRYLSQEESKNQDVFLDEGDLLFTRLSGSVDYVANCAVVRSIDNQKIQYPDRIFRAKLIDYSNPNFCEWWFSTTFLRSLITKDAKSSAGHQRISMGAITKSPIPMPH